MTMNKAVLNILKKLGPAEVKQKPEDFVIPENILLELKDIYKLNKNSEEAVDFIINKYNLSESHKDLLLKKIKTT